MELMTLLYLGPGMGAGAIITIIGIILLVVVTLVTFLWFPVKRMLKRRKKQ